MTCSKCVFYEPQKEGYTCGTCEYPVPEYLVISGCKYIGNPDYSGANCATFKSKKQVALDELQKT